MSTTRVYANLAGTLEVIRPPGSSGMSSKTRNTIIAGVTLLSAILVASAIWLTLHCRRRRAHINLAELPDDTEKRQNTVRIDEKTQYELTLDEKYIYEMSGEEWLHEATDTMVLVEADRSNFARPKAAELSATNVAANGK